MKLSTLDKLNVIVKEMKRDGLTKQDIDYAVKLMMGRKVVIDSYYNSLKKYKLR